FASIPVTGELLEYDERTSSGPGKVPVPRTFGGGEEVTSFELREASAEIPVKGFLTFEIRILVSGAVPGTLEDGEEGTPGKLEGESAPWKDEEGASSEPEVVQASAPGTLVGDKPKSLGIPLASFLIFISRSLFVTLKL